MKVILHISLVLIFALLCSPMARAQIKNDESSISILAIQCAMSSGFPASGFQEYSVGLAKTLSLLSGDQQERVFGYVPQPGMVSMPKAGEKSRSTASKASPPSGDTTSPDMGILTEIVDAINGAIFGDDTSPLPVIAGFETTPPNPDKNMGAGEIIDGVFNVAGNTPVDQYAGISGAAVINGATKTDGVTGTGSNVNATTGSSAHLNSGSSSQSVTGDTAIGNSSVAADSGSPLAGLNASNPDGSTSQWDSLTAWLIGAKDAYDTGGQAGLIEYVGL